MNIFRFEFRQAFKGTVIWAIVYALGVFSFMSATPMFLNESGAMKDMLSRFPPMLLTAMGFDIESFFSPVGFYSYIFLYISLAAAIHSMNLGLSIFSKENRMKTSDFLLTKPVCRTSVFSQKLLATLCSLFICQIVFFAVAYSSMLWQAGGEFAFMPFVLISLTFSFVQLIYAGCGIFLSTVLPKVKSPITITMGVTFITFMLGMIGAMAESEALRYLSPLKYFENNYILLNSAYETRFLILGTVLFLGFVVTGYLIYVKKDVKSLT